MGRKWQNIKLDKGKTDAQRGALFTKLSKEITLSAKGGSPDPESNHRLKLAVEKAREQNMPMDNIKRAIARGSGASDEKEIEELRYEGYGPHGVAVVIDAATDNRNRTAGELRFLFTKNGGALGESGSVGWLFESVGIIEVQSESLSEDALTERALVDGVVDVEYDTPTSFVYTDPSDLAATRTGLTAAKLRVSDAYLGVRAKQKAAVEGAALRDVLAFLGALDDHEDVQRAFSNLEMSDAEAEALL